MSKEPKEPKKECTVTGCENSQSKGYDRCCRHIECKTDGCETYAKNGDLYCRSCIKRGNSQSRKEKVDPTPPPGKDEDLCTYGTCPRTPKTGRRCSDHKKCLGNGCTKLRQDETFYCRNCQKLSEKGELQEESDRDDQPRPYCTYPGCETRPLKDVRCGEHKPCETVGCPNLAQRTSTSSYCIACGGGPRCEWEKGCKNCAIAPTKFCFGHGGGPRCKIDGCKKGARNTTDLLCKAHGGGERCKIKECTKSARLPTKFCVYHGGGYRCKIKDCIHGARDSKDLLCKEHGGGPRCKIEECPNSACSSIELLCKKHGGDYRCIMRDVHGDDLPTVYKKDPSKSLCWGCYCAKFPYCTSRRLRREHFLIAEVQRLCEWLESHFISWDCPLPCSRFRPDCLWDMGIVWLAIEVDENGHDQHPEKYPDILRIMNERPGLLIRINPDNKKRKLLREVNIGIGELKGQTLWEGTNNFVPYMEIVAKLLNKELFNLVKKFKPPKWIGVKEIKMNFE